MKMSQHCEIVLRYGVQKYMSMWFFVVCVCVVLDLLWLHYSMERRGTKLYHKGCRWKVASWAMLWLADANDFCFSKNSRFHLRKMKECGKLQVINYTKYYDQLVCDFEAYQIQGKMTKWASAVIGIYPD